MSLIISAHFHGSELSSLPETLSQFCFFHVARAVGRVGDQPDHHFLLRPSARDYSVVVVWLAHVAPAAVELRVVPCYARPETLFELFHVKTAQILFIAQRWCDRRESHEEGLAKVGFEMIDQTDHTAEGHCFFNVQWLVPFVKAFKGAIKFCVRPLSCTAEHAEDFYTCCLKLFDFIPKRDKFVCVVEIIVEGDTRRRVEVNSRDDDVIFITNIQRNNVGAGIRINVLRLKSSKCQTSILLSGADKETASWQLNLLLLRLGCNSRKHNTFVVRSTELRRRDVESLNGAAPRLIESLHFKARNLKALCKTGPSYGNEIRLRPRSASLDHILANVLSKQLFRNLTNVLVDVQVLRSREKTIRSLDIVAVSRSGAILVHINRNMGRKFTEEFLDVTRLLTSKLDVITVGIKAGSENALEIVVAVGVVPRHDDDVDILEHLGSPLGVIVKLAEESEHGLISSWFISMDTGVDKDSQFV
ncbi:hypothetical protein HG531_010024 [Fusarium graminearum]|nr:hypothetical protein HG531_010024 [Fusarium graminearum]